MSYPRRRVSSSRSPAAEKMLVDSCFRGNDKGVVFLEGNPNITENG